MQNDLKTISVIFICVLGVSVAIAIVALRWLNQRGDAFKQSILSAKSTFTDPAAPNDKARPLSDEYLRQGLYQSKISFMASLIFGAVGFGVIVISVYLSFYPDFLSSDPLEKDWDSARENAATFKLFAYTNVAALENQIESVKQK